MSREDGASPWRQAPPIRLPRREGRSLASVRTLVARVGGADRVRTGDLRLARAALSQLSYSPLIFEVVGLSGFEPLTSRLSAVRSSQLSYRPVAVRPEAAPPRMRVRLGSKRPFGASADAPGGSLKTR